MGSPFNTAFTPDSTVTWLTPRKLLDRLGHFDLDPCAATVRPWDCADKNYTVEDNGLLRPWHGRVWCNPPYGREVMPPFVHRMAEHGDGLLMIFVRTGTRLWQDVILRQAAGIFFLAGKVRFCRENGKAPKNGGNAPSCLVCFSRSEFPLLQSLEGEGLGVFVEMKGGACGNA